MRSLMLVPVAVSEEIKQTDTQTDRIALYILDLLLVFVKVQLLLKEYFLLGILGYVVKGNI